MCLCCVNEATLGKFLGSLSMKVGPRGTNYVIRGLELSVSPPTFGEGRGAEDCIQSSMANDFINHAYVRKPT